MFPNVEHLPRKQGIALCIDQKYAVEFQIVYPYSSTVCSVIDFKQLTLVNHSPSPDKNYKVEDFFAIWNYTLGIHQQKIYPISHTTKTINWKFCTLYQQNISGTDIRNKNRKK